MGHLISKGAARSKSGRPRLQTINRLAGCLAHPAATNEVDDREQDDGAQQRIKEALDGQPIVEAGRTAEQEAASRVLDRLQQRTAAERGRP